MSKFGYSEVGVSGRVIGQTHHKAKLTDADVERIRDLHAEGYGYKRLAKMFDAPRDTIRHIVLCRTRAQTAVSVKKAREGRENG